jgi:hypothetical protein
MGQTDGKVFKVMSNRKVIIWFFSLLAVLVLYFLFTWSSPTPQIVIDKSADQPESTGISEQPAGRVGKIGDVGIGAVQQARYTHLNSRKEVDREFGFEKLIHEMGDEWEIEKPFMNIFRRDFECRITADSGKVQVQVAGGRPVPKDASLNGNVVIHIIPTADSDVTESFIYLDDIIFISERSQFSTKGPVKFVNDNAKLTGKGLELVYNEQTRRLDFLRIMHLDDLSLRIPSKENSSSRKSELQTAGAGSMPADTVAAKPQHDKSGKDKKGEYYKCTLNGNVVINTPEQVVVADELLINDIFQSKEKKSKDHGGNSSGKSGTAPAAQGEPNEPGKFTDINVSCDNGITVTPKDSQIPYASPADKSDTTAADRVVKIAGRESKRAAFAAQKIDYSLSDNTVTLEGDCLCTAFQNETNGLRKHTLSSQKITVTLSREKEDKPFAWAEGIKKVVAEGGVVQLATAKMTGEKILGFSKLKCSRFEYDSDSDKLVANGPGLIAIDNSNIAPPQKQKVKPAKFGLRRQCYAVVRDFQTLTYDLKSNTFSADNSGGGLIIDYFPVDRGKTDTQVTITAGHIDAKLLDMPAGGMELMNLTATGGVTYEEKDIQFAGSNLIYDADSSMINIKGDKSQPCLLNGALVDAIKYDLKKNKFKAEVRSPGALQFK